MNKQSEEAKLLSEGYKLHEEADMLLNEADILRDRGDKLRITADRRRVEADDAWSRATKLRDAARLKKVEVCNCSCGERGCTSSKGAWK